MVKSGLVMRAPLDEGGGRSSKKAARNAEPARPELFDPFLGGDPLRSLRECVGQC